MINRSTLVTLTMTLFALTLSACGGGGGGNPPGDLNFPDLVAGRNPSLPAFYMDYDSGTGEVIVWVRNEGSLQSPSTYVSITFFGSGGSVLGTVESATRTGVLDPGELSGEIRVAIVNPGACFAPNCRFLITVDSRGEVSESREDNNQQNASILG